MGRDESGGFNKFAKRGGNFRARNFLAAQLPAVCVESPRRTRRWNSSAFGRIRRGKVNLAAPGALQQRHTRIMKVRTNRLTAHLREMTSFQQQPHASLSTALQSSLRESIRLDDEPIPSLRLKVICSPFTAEFLKTSVWNIKHFSSSIATFKQNLIVPA